ncbi:amidohydrolase family protein [Bacillus cytotoxicus]
MICINNIRLIIGDNLETIETGFIVFDQERIIEVSNQPLLNLPTECQVVDGTGLTALPGLIDAHVHLGMDCSPDPFFSMSHTDDTTIAYLAYKQGIQFLESGITTVRNLGTRNNIDIQYRDSIQKNIIDGPRVFASGNPIIITGGHGQAMGIEVDGIDEIRKASRTQIKAGADLLKLMATGGVLTKGNKPASVQLTIDELKCACQEAKNANIATVAHAIGIEGVKNAIRAGVHTIEHGYYLDNESIQMMINQDVYLIPTLLAPILILNNPNQIPQHMLDKLEDIEVHHRKSFRSALSQGVKIAVGTDAGTPYNFPGQIVDEMKIMVDEGMSNLQAIQAATSVGAACLKIDSLTGTLEKGKWADILIVEGNPLENILDLKNVKQVFKAGKPCLNTYENITHFA